ncbi:hypothetical protein MTR_6g057740 [Medicago truncatula]|uniref:Uncharacterized protein n=1 Tax=Medicago truncatula TaxID=3880 RepID=G7KMF2_MEDTR|nr:hypothetical protein MTR_6g057740 [Medicago truncatula]
MATPLKLKRKIARLGCRYNKSIAEFGNKYCDLTRVLLTFTHYFKAEIGIRVSSRLNSSKSSDVVGSISPENGRELPYELHHDLSLQRHRHRSPVFVTLPVKFVGLEGRIWSPKAMMLSLKANQPRVYDWRGYRDLVRMACMCGLKVRVVPNGYVVIESFV